MHGIRERDAELSRLRTAGSATFPGAAAPLAALPPRVEGTTAAQEQPDPPEASAASGAPLTDAQRGTAAQELAGARDAAAAAAERHQSITALVEQVAVRQHRCLCCKPYTASDPAWLLGSHSI